jgi:galactonate dehydratase
MAKKSMDGSILRFMMTAEGRRARLKMPLALQPATGEGLEITELKVWTVREPVSLRRYSVVRVTTRSGVRGYGEGPPVGARELELARQAVVGTPAAAYEVAAGRLAAAPGMRVAVNMAQLDVLARHAGAPLYQVLGGPTRNKVRVLAPLSGGAALERAQARGFRAFSAPAPVNEFRNAGRQYVQKVVQLVERLRRAAPEGDFVLDGGGALVAGDAQTVAAAVEPYHLLWFDEPTAVSNLGAVRKIAGESVTPVGFGRTLGHAGEYQDLLREDAVDILRPSLGKHPLSEIRRIAAIAEVYYVAVAPYHDGGPLATAAALHVAASLPNFFIQQIPVAEHARDEEMRAAMVSPNVEAVSGGFAALPVGAGLGVTVNEAALERYQEAG